MTGRTIGRILRPAALAILGLTASAALARALPLDPGRWRIEAESPASRVTRAGDAIDIESPRGLTLWYPKALKGPVSISFEAMAVSAGGANDQVSDLNAFWMATETDGASPLDHPRTGRFEDYDTLKTYYVGIGGNRNTTTRMRRYVGQPGLRPLRPENDRPEKAAMLVPNRWTRITLIADGTTIAVTRDGQPLFKMVDLDPYRWGWFGLRTTWSHLRVRGLRISRP